jgi:hypothetical protein
MPRRKPRSLEAYRYELGTYERQLAKDAIFVSGLRAAGGVASSALLALGLVGAGFLAFNKVDDLKEWVSDQWQDGFGLVNDPEQTQEQVSQYVSPHRTPSTMDGMSTSSIYSLHYNMRDDLRLHFARMWCEFEDREFTGPNVEFFNQFVWSTCHLGTSFPAMPTYRFERSEVIQIAGEDVNSISEYVYQMIIRETDSRNTQARLTSGLMGAASTGIGAAFSEATHWALRSSGFMRGSDGWDGQNWEEAPGANRDPLLNYAWGRTDFQTGHWWSTVDSQGDVAFWMEVLNGGQGGVRINTTRENPEGGFAEDMWSYEQLIYYAHEEMQNAEFGPFLQYLSTQGGMPLVASSAIPPDEIPPAPTEEEEEAIREQGRQEQEETAPDDDRMPGEDAPPDDEEEYGRRQ